MQQRKYRFIQGMIICATLLTLMIISSCSAKGKKIFMIDPSRGNRFGETKLEKVNDRLFKEGSVLKISSFDGKKLKTYTVREEEQIKKIKDRLDKMKFKKAEALPEEAIKPPFYGIQITNKEETEYGDWATDYAWTNGYLVTWDNIVYTGNFDFEQLMEGILSDSEETASGASDFPCANWLLKKENGFRAEYLSRAAEKEVEKDIHIEQALAYRAGDEYMRVLLKLNDPEEEQTAVIQRFTDNPLQVNISGDWYIVPDHSRMKKQFSPGKGFSDPYSTVNTDRTFDVTIPLTYRYGNLPAGDYRWDILQDTGLYINFHLNKYGQMDLGGTVDQSIMMDIFGSIRTLDSTMDLLVYEDGVVRVYKIKGTEIGETRQRVNDTLMDSKIMPVPSQVPINGLRGPYYSISMTDIGGTAHYFCWADGYLVTDNGIAYRFNYDFGQLLKEYSYEETLKINVQEKPAWLEIPFYSMITAETMIYYDNAISTGKCWHRELMRKQPDNVPAEGLTLHLTSDPEKSGIIRGVIENRSEESWEYWRDTLVFELGTEIDGEWYYVPMKPDISRPIDSEKAYLPPEKSLVRTYEVETVYGRLPNGHYRIREGNGPQAEFTVDKEGKIIIPE